MTTEEVKINLRRIVSDQLGEPETEIQDEMTLHDLGADSLDVIEIIMRIEETLDVQITDADISKCKTFDDLFECTLKAIGEK